MYFYRGQGGFVLRLTYLLLTFFFHLAIFLVALVGLAHFWLPMVGDYKEVLEKELSSFVGSQISIGQIRVDPDSESPRWIMENLQLTEADGYSPIHIQQLALTLDWRESLRTLRLQPADIQLEGVEFALYQQSGSLPEVRGLRFPLPGQKNTTLNIERKSPIRISVNGGYVHWTDAASHRTLTLSDLQFLGEFLPDEITLQADALFPPAIGETLGVDAVMRHVELPDGKTDWEGKLHTRTHIYNLATLPAAIVQEYGIHSGSLELDATITAATGKPLHISGGGEIQHLGWQGNAHVPALNNVNASFSASNDGGKVDVSVNDSVLNYPQWFERELLIDRMTSDLQWRVADDGWHWQIGKLQLENPDLTAQGSGTLHVPLDKPPDLNLAMSFATRQVVNNVRDYIPAIVDDDTEHWLKTAIVAGYVPRGEFTLRGNPADYPFKQKNGIFDIRFDVEQGVLAYLPEWPEARDVSGTLRFYNEGMSATVKSAHIMDLNVTGGTVDIPNMLQYARLLLDLKTEGDLQGHMNYLRDSPLGKNLRDFMQVAEFAGNSRLHLKLDVPLTQQVLDRDGVVVDGVVELQDNRFAIPGYNQVFSKLNGKVHFDQSGVEAQDASGEYRQQPVKLGAVTDRKKNLITVMLNQHNDPTLFLPDSLAVLKPYVQGKTVIETRVELPAFGNDSSSQTPANLKITAKSSLQGVALHLPAPLHKAAEDIRELLVEVKLPFDSAKPWDVTVNLFKQLSVTARLPHKGKQQLAMGISLGGKEATLPDKGMQVTGELAEVDLMALQGLGMAAAPRQGKQATTLLIKANINIGKLLLGEQSLGKASLQVEGDDIMQAHLRAEKAQANLHLPLRTPGSGRVNLDLTDIDLNKLNRGLSAGGKDSGKGLSPKGFPSMRFSCLACRKGDFPIQQLILNMNKSRNDLQIETLEIRNPLLILLAKQGRWYEDRDGVSRTELVATANIPEPGRLLEEQGSPAGLKGGALTANASLGWIGAPFNFALPKLEGDISARLTSGSLTEVEPGLGRLLGLLDVQRLPSRLSMDFRDMTGKGVAFDEITGTFRLEHGVLTTRNTIIKAAILVAGIQGSTDLVRKTHNQTVTIMPNLNSALPLVGAAVGGLGGGAAMLLFNSVTEKPAEDKLKSSGGFRYRVTGSWVKPDIAEIKASPGATDVDVLLQ